MSLLKNLILFCTLGLALPNTLKAQTDMNTLRARIHRITAATDGKVGVSVLGLDFDSKLTINEGRYPMQSTFKLPLAMYILHRVQQGKLSLKQQVHIRRSELDLHTWSPMLTDFKQPAYNMSLEQLLRYSVGKSDNNACDILFRLVGGTKPLNGYIHGLGVTNIEIAATEDQMKTAWQVQYTNWCYPAAYTQMLDKVFTNQSSFANYALLMKMMYESENSPKRLKGLLPAGTEVAHKTGTSNTNARGMTAATNDVGIITLPNGKHYAIAVFVSDYKGGVPQGERIIAEISKVVWDFYAAQ